MANIVFHPAGDRGHADHGWLDAHHSFSFAGYNDPEKVHFGVLRVLNDDTVSGGMGFGKHPHDNMEIITIILDGALEHKDSMGHAEAIQTNEVQVMSAGSGVFHSEYNHNRDKKVNLLQIWIFPNKRNVEPRYGQKFFLPEERINTLQTLVSSIDNEDPGLKIHQDAKIFRSNLQKGNSVTHNLKSAKHGLYIFLIKGQVDVDSKTLNKRDAIGISATETVNITASEDSDVLVLEVPMEL